MPNVVDSATRVAKCVLPGYANLVSDWKYSFADILRLFARPKQATSTLASKSIPCGGDHEGRDCQYLFEVFV